MADSVIEDEILTALRERGPITTPTHGGFRHKAGISGSSKQVKRALGSLVKRGMVYVRRPCPEAPAQSSPPPVTYGLKQYV